MAEHLDVTEEFLKDALDAYLLKYGKCTVVDNYMVFFEPLGVVDMNCNSQGHSHPGKESLCPCRRVRTSLYQCRKHLRPDRGREYKTRTKSPNVGLQQTDWFIRYIIRLQIWMSELTRNGRASGCYRNIS